MKRNLCVVLLALLLTLPAMAGKSEVVAEGNRLWISSADAAPGGQVTVDLMIANSSVEVDAVTLEIKYDASKLQFVDWADGSLDPGWVMFNINEKTPGTIKIGGFCVKTAIKAGSKGSIAKLNFKAKGNAGDFGYISFDKISDDVQGFNYENGKVEIKAAALKK